MSQTLDPVIENRDQNIVENENKNKLESQRMQGGNNLEVKIIFNLKNLIKKFKYQQQSILKRPNSDLNRNYPTTNTAIRRSLVDTNGDIIIGSLSNRCSPRVDFEEIVCFCFFCKKYTFNRNLYWKKRQIDL